MRVAIGASGVLLAALAIGCGSSGPKNDHDALEQLWKDYFGAIESGSANAAAKLYTKECGDVSKQLDTLMQALAPIREDGSFDVTGVEIQNNDGKTAETMPVGTLTYAGNEQDITSDAFTAVVKEDGRWKFSGCNILGGGFFAQPTQQDGGAQP